LQFDFAAKELTIKLVYYGPALSGKTTNLQSLHLLADSASRGRLMTLETRDDRTLFFDMLPFVLLYALVLAITYACVALGQILTPEWRLRPPV